MARASGNSLPALPSLAKSGKLSQERDGQDTRESGGHFKRCAIHGAGFPDSSAGKESACNAGDPGLISGSGRSPGEGIGYPLQFSGLENSMDCIVHGVAKSLTRLSDFHIHGAGMSVLNQE